VRRCGALAVVFFLIGGFGTGCGGSRHPVGTRTSALPASYIPVPFGRGSRYRPAALSVGVAVAAPVGGMQCTSAATRRYGAHLELFAHRRVIAIPAGVGVAPPQRRSAAYLLGGRCSYPLRTVEPTGVIELADAPARALGDFFALWGQPLSRSRVLSFRGAVHAFVDGLPWSGDPRAIPLRRHAQIVLEVSGPLPPHTSYWFANGL
jgi:hypothetical protein